MTLHTLGTYIDEGYHMHTSWLRCALKAARMYGVDWSVNASYSQSGFSDQQICTNE